MGKRQHALRNIALKLNVSGTAEILEEQRLYKGSYGFVKLQVYVPRTQNTEGPLLTAFCTTVDELGREVISSKNYNLLYVDEYEIDGFVYLLFESLLPREFTEKATQPDGLKITFNYCDSVPIYDDDGGEPLLDTNGIPQRMATDVLISSRYVTTVYPGGWNPEGVKLDINSSEAAVINEHTGNIAELQADMLKLNQTFGEVFNKNIKEIFITYQIGENGASPPKGEWTEDIPKLLAGDYLWTKITFVFQDASTETAYTVAAPGVAGEQGVEGAKGEKGDKGDKGDSFYTFSVQGGDLVVKTNTAGSPDVTYSIDDFGNMILTIN